MIQFIEYPKCTTCKKAKAWLVEQGVDFTTRHIIEDVPTHAELKVWHNASGLPLKRFFNTSGIVYKELQLSQKLATITENEQLDLLASNGMLIKRPFLITDRGVCPGFKEAIWQDLLI